jgi:hypothetical protein
MQFVVPGADTNCTSQAHVILLHTPYLFVHPTVMTCWQLLRPAAAVLSTRSCMSFDVFHLCTELRLPIGCSQWRCKTHKSNVNDHE